VCGICGFTGRADRGLLEKMSGTIMHRGPDEDGFYSRGGVNLAIRRLSIIDVETGHQPVHNEDGSVWTVFNGEVYNFGELRAELERAGHRFYTDHSDTEVIVHLYEEYGEEFVHRLNGMFAIALWDARGAGGAGKSGQLFLIRDRMGVKPLFWSMIAGELVFGSEIKAILAHPGYSSEPDFEALYHYFTYKNIPAPMTAFASIRSLSPGAMLRFSGGEVTRRKWWRLRFDAGVNGDEGEVKETILSLLEDATRLRMISDVPFGAYLSGGVDSSVVVALMDRFSDKPIRTFSLGYEDELENKEADLFHARRVSKAFGTEHHEYIMSSSELTGDIEEVIGAFDQPFSGTISTFFLSKLIAKHVKVALSGDGADELFGSYLSHRVARPMHHFARLHGARAHGGEFTESELAFFAPCDVEFLANLYEKSEGDPALWRYNLLLFTDWELERLLSIKFRARTRGASSLELLKAGFEDLRAPDPLNRILELEWQTQLPDQVLAFVDFLSMAHSVEVRSPFLDYRLVEFVATVPGEMKIRDGVVKDILKRSVEGVIPDGITKRPKEGFVLPVYDWLAGRLEGYARELLSEERLSAHGLLNAGEVGRVVDGYYDGNRENAGRLWNLMMFQVWWEKYFG